ncbi:MAG: hypothetical protein JKY54_01720, partial [Flavobacteriales bacterium]|nr:hypothetical protein [Flavobacteriales bacterium]
MDMFEEFNIHLKMDLHEYQKMLKKHNEDVNKNKLESNHILSRKGISQIERGALLEEKIEELSDLIEEKEQIKAMKKIKRKFHISNSQILFNSMALLVIIIGILSVSNQVLYAALFWFSIGVIFTLYKYVKYLLNYNEFIHLENSMLMK